LKWRDRAGPGQDVGSGSEWEWQVAGGRKEEPGQHKKERTQNRKSKRQKRGRGMDEMGMGMLKWISSQFDNFVGAGLELELTVGNSTIQCTPCQLAAGAT
jgi:hypothetical protein